MRLIAFFFIVYFAALAQTQQFTLSTGGTLTASGGDGSACIVSKVPGTTVSLTALCTPGNGGPVANLTLTQKAGASGAATYQAGDITCIVGMNATGAAAAISPTFSVPPSAAVLNCAVNLRATPTGPITGNAAVPPQTLVWP